MITKICIKCSDPSASNNGMYVGLDGSFYTALPYQTDAGKACDFGTAERAVDYITLSGIRNVVVVQLDLTIVETIIPCI